MSLVMVPNNGIIVIGLPFFKGELKKIQKALEYFEEACGKAACQVSLCALLSYLSDLYYYRLGKQQQLVANSK